MWMATNKVKLKEEKNTLIDTANQNINNGGIYVVNVVNGKDQ